MSENSSPLDGFRIVEMGERIGAAFCGRLLADLGADVIRAERADTVRTDITTGATPSAALSVYLGAGKRSVLVTAGERDTADCMPLRSLLADADALVTGISRHDPEADALSPAFLTTRFPALTVAAISPFGATGPYADWRGSEFEAAALSGITWRIGAPNRPPLTLPLDQAGFQGGIGAAIAIVCSLIARRRTGRGQGVDVAEADVLATLHAGYSVTRFQLAGNNERREGHRFGNQPYPQTVLPCMDGFVELNAPEGRQWKRFLEMIGSPEWGADPKFRNRVLNNIKHADELDALIQPWLATRTRAEIFALARDHNLPCGPVRTINEIVDDPHLAQRGFFVEASEPESAAVRVPAFPARFSESPRRGGGRVSRRGADTAAIRAAADKAVQRAHAAHQAVPAQSGGPSRDPSGQPDTFRGPLAGYRVLDLGWVWAGAIPGQILADMGAEVIKVESRERIDYMRLGRPIRPDGADTEQNPWFHAVNRNKKSITINLKTERGVALVRDLAAHCDIVIENFAPGFLARVGLDFSALHSVNPKLVMLSMSGTGQSGPDSNIPAYAPLLAGLSGLDSLVGYPGEGTLGIQQPYADSTAGILGALSVVAALVQRERTARGQHIDLAEQEAVISVLGEAVAEYGLVGQNPVPQGNDRLGVAPRGHYPCCGDDSWIALSVRTDTEWCALCAVLDASELANDSRYATAVGRWTHRRALDEAIAERTQPLAVADVVAQLQKAGVAAAVRHGPETLMTDPHFESRQTFVDIEHPVLGRERVYGLAWHLSETPGGVRRHAPILGEHNREVFGSILGLVDAEIDALAAEGVIA